ncbi:MAG: hypothetical protein O7C75_14870 [Verrucomicrobia bacterium]|nr:hypothetical protein [Verrucomicrobiota bacterium]
MDNGTIITCTGIKTGSVNVPPFQLKKGEYLCFHCPFPIDSDKGRDLIKIFTSRKRIKGVEVCEHISLAKDLEYQTYLGGLIYRKISVKDYLRKKIKLTDSEIETITVMEKISDGTLLPHLSLTKRILLSIEVNYTFSNAIIFTTIGVDPGGLNHIYKKISMKLEQGYSAMHFYGPVSPSRTCYFGGTCIECEISKE